MQILNSWLKKDWCKNNSIKSSATKVDEDILCGYLLSTIYTFYGKETKHEVCRGKDCIKKFSKSLELHAMVIIKFEKIKWCHQ